MSTELEARLLEITDTFAQGQIEAALAAMTELEQGCKTNRERSQVMARYVTFFHLLDLEEEELSALAQALALDPQNPRANYLHAVHLMADERWDDAILALNTAARYYPPDDSLHLAEVYGNLSYCWAQQGDEARAEMYREISSDLDPEGVLSEPGEPAPDEDPGVEFIPASLEEEPELDLPLSERIALQVHELTGRPLVAARPARAGDGGPAASPAADRSLAPGSRPNRAERRRAERERSIRESGTREQASQKKSGRRR